MKISFSTLACSDFSWVDIYTMAKDLGYDGIELHGLGHDINLNLFRAFSDSQLSKTLSKLRELNLEIPCLSSGCCLKNKENEKENKEEIQRFIDLANKLSTPFIRVLADSSAEPGEGVDDDYIADILSELSVLAETKDVVLLVETNGVFSDTGRLKKLLDKVNSPYVGALWDIHHPYRYFGESPEKTVDNLGEYIRYLHVKDSVMTNNSPEYRMMGDGDLPLDDVFEELAGMRYDGYISFEWVPGCFADSISDIGIVFPHFAEYGKKFRSRGFKSLPCNKSKTGEYIWRKNRLISSTFPDVLDRVCEEFPKQYAFRYTELDYTRTYPQFRDDVDMFARALIALGVKKGDNVAVWATNVPQWYIAFWATTKIGAVLVTVNTAYKTFEMEYLLKQSDTHTLIMIDGYKGTSYVDIIKAICPELSDSVPGELRSKKLPYLKNIVTIGVEVDGCYTWEDTLKMALSVPVSEVERRRSKIECEDVCNMQYTSGTTGFPKGVMLTHYNVVNNGKSIGDCLDLSTADKMMIHVPMFHCFGMVLAMTACMTHGATMCPITAFSPRKSLDCINREKITAFHGVPTMFIAMLEHPDFTKTDFSHVRTGIMAGSPCPVKVMQDVIEKMNMKEICITYGQTESSPGCTMSKIDDSLEHRVSTVGRPLYGVECKIVDPETNEELPSDTDGEFVARGYNIMKGYYKMPEATSAAIDDDGWLHTGDLARKTSDGYYKITGRIKDMIIRGGENIYPKEIEEFIYTYPKVKDVQVIGVPDRQYGEEIMACIILKDGESANEDDIREFVRENMAKHKVPKYIDFVKEFPMNAAGKILKYKMREEAVIKLKLQEAGRIVTA